MDIRKQYIFGKPKKRCNLSVHQYSGKKYDLSYNPDDDMFYVTDKENNTKGRCTRFANATYYFKKLEGLI
jgi:hypothetical protein